MRQCYADGDTRMPVLIGGCGVSVKVCMKRSKRGSVAWSSQHKQRIQKLNLLSFLMFVKSKVPAIFNLLEHNNKSKRVVVQDKKDPRS